MEKTEVLCTDMVRKICIKQLLLHLNRGLQKNNKFNHRGKENYCRAKKSPPNHTGLLAKKIPNWAD